MLADHILADDRFKLQRLILEGCSITDDIVSLLCQPLQDSNTALRYLNLSSNDIREAGAHRIAEMLKVNTTLTVLFLHWNKIKAKGGAYLAQALQVNQTLQILDVSFCGMGSNKENQAGGSKKK